MGLGKIRTQHANQGLAVRFTETRGRVTFNGDGRYWRSWRLFDDGRLERVNASSQYKEWIAGEDVPVEIVGEAERLGISIRDGRGGIPRHGRH
jgi:hypothetical protein